MNTTYKNATIWDAVRIIPLWIKMMKETITGTGFSGNESSPEIFFINLLATIKNPNASVIIVENNKRLIGFIKSFIKYAEYSDTKLLGVCECIYVEKEYRNQNIDRELIDLAIKKGTELGAKEWEFITVYDLSLVKIWERKGYKPMQIVFRKEV